MATELCIPDSDGSYNDWNQYPTGTPEYERVDDGTAIGDSDDDSTYIWRPPGLVQDHESIYGLTLSGSGVKSGDTINWIKVHFVGRWTDNGDDDADQVQVRPILYHGGTFDKSQSGFALEDANEDASDYTEYTSAQFDDKPGGSGWTFADLAALQFGINNSTNGAFKAGGQARVTMVWIEIDYTVSSGTDLAPTSLQCDRLTNPTYVGDTPVFSAIYNADGDSGTCSKYKIEVDDDSGFGSPKWSSGEQTLSPTCTDNQRCAEIPYGGTSLKSDVTYYWRIQLYESGRTPTWSTGTNTFKGIDRDWEDAEYPLREKMTLDPSHNGIAAGELLSFDLETGKRIILATDGDFDEAIQASGGFSVARHAGRTHVVYLSKLEAVNGQLGIRVVSINHLTGEVGTSHYIDSANTYSDTHHFPVIDVTPDGYLHVFYGAHYNEIRYRRSKYVNESGSLSTDHTDDPMWVNANTGADTHMEPSGVEGAYPVPFHILTGADAGRLYLFWRNVDAPNEKHYSFIYSDDSGSTWSAAHDFIKDNNGSAYRVYCYGIRFDRTNQRLHISWTHTHSLSGEKEMGIWWASSDYDETDGSSLDVGFNIFRWADETVAGRTKLIGSGSQVPIDYDTGQAILTRSDELSVIFTVSLVLDKSGSPVPIWEQKFEQGTYLYAEQTNLMCATLSGHDWTVREISDQVNTRLRVRRSAVSIGTDRDGVIHALMPVSSKTQWCQFPTGDDDDVGVVRQSGADNYAMIDDGFGRVGQSTWLKLDATSDKASFTHGTGLPDDIKKMFSVEVVVFAQSTGGTATLKLYLDDGTTTDLGTGQAISQSAITRYTEEWLTNPFETRDWLPTDIAGLRFGIQTDSTNEAQVYTVFMRFTFTRATDENYGASEIHELTSSDNGVTWQVQELSRNAMNGVPMMSHKHHMAGDVFEAVWTSGHQIFYYVDERFGEMLPTGIDVRIFHGATEIDRVADHWNVTSSRISFQAQEAITAGEIAGASDYYLYYGNRNAANDVQGAAADIWQGFWNFEEMDEFDPLSDHADWSYVSGTALIYSGLKQHRNKVYAGANSVRTLTYSFEAKASIGTDVSDVFIECGIWMEGSTNYSYIEAYDLTGAIGFRVGVNATTNRPAYYDGTWHDVTTAGYADKANMNSFAILVTSQGCSAWVNGVRICTEVTRITVVDEIRIGAESQTFFDLIRWSKRPLSRVTGEITSSFDDAEGIGDSDHTSTVGVDDVHHDITSSIDNITRVDVFVKVRHNHGVSVCTVSTHCWIGGTSPYDSSDTVANATHDHTGVDEASSAWQSSHTFSFNTLDPGAKSVKVDAYASTGTDGLLWSELQIWKIVYYTEDADPIIVLGDMESRGFIVDAVLEGAGQFSFLVDANTDAAFMRISGSVALEAGAGVEASQLAVMETGRQITIDGRVSIGSGALFTAHAQCVLESLRGVVSPSVALLEYAGQLALVQQAAIGSLAGLTTEGRACLEFQKVLNLDMMTALEYGAGIGADGQFVIDYQGSVAHGSIVVIESLHSVEQHAAVPIEILAGLLARGQVVTESAGGIAGQQQVVLGYVGAFQSDGIFAVEHLVILKVRHLGVIGTGAGVKADGIVPFGAGQGLKDGQSILPIAILGDTRLTSQVLSEWSSVVTPTEGQVVFDPGAAVAARGTAVVENLKSLLMNMITPVEWQGSVVVTQEGRLPVEWTGGVTMRAQALLESGAGLAADAVLQLDFAGGLAVGGQSILSNLAALEAPQAAILEYTGSLAAKMVSVVEWAKGLAATGQLPCDWLTALRVASQINTSWRGWLIEQHQAAMEYGASFSQEGQAAAETGQGTTAAQQAVLESASGLAGDGRALMEWAGGQAIVMSGKMPIEWTLGIDANGAVAFDFGQRQLVDAITPFGYGAGVLSTGQTTVAIDALVSMIHQVSIENLMHLQDLGQVNFDTGTITKDTVRAALEYGVGLVADGIAPVDWTGIGAFKSEGQLPISWLASVSVRAQAGIEWTTGLEVVGGRVLIDWGATIKAAHGGVPVEWAAGVKATAGVLASWLGTLDASGRVVFEHLGTVNATMIVDIEWGVGVTTRSSVPLEHAFGVMATGQLPMDWFGFAVTMFTVLQAEVRIPGVVGATAKLPGVAEALVKNIEIKQAQARIAEVQEATATIIDTLDAHIKGGV